MPRIRPFRPGDETALAEICLRTADAGGDATGLLPDDGLWADMFVLPYVARHPETAFVVEREDGMPLGYIVSAPDTDAFEAWFHDQWWPRFADRRPAPEGGDGEPLSREDDLLAYAYERGTEASRYQAAGYPAHLHIDLLPELQGQGWGRRLVEVLVARLREDGVPGLHLVASAENTGAAAFYPRVGFSALPGPESIRAFGMRL